MELIETLINISALNWKMVIITAGKIGIFRYVFVVSTLGLFLTFFLFEIWNLSPLNSIEKHGNLASNCNKPTKVYEKT